MNWEKKMGDIRPKQFNYTDGLSDKKSKTFGLAALIYASMLLFILVDACIGGFKTGNDGWSFFYYFTYQSNILVMAWLFAFGITRFVGKNSKVSKFLTHHITMIALTLYMSLTFLTVALVLGNHSILSGVYVNEINSTGFFTHWLTPIIMWVFFIFVPGHGKLEVKSILKRLPYLLIYPLIYVASNLIVGELTVWTEGTAAGKPAYAYDFLNPHVYANIGIYICVIVGFAAALFGLGVAMIFMKKKLFKSYYKASEKVEEIEVKEIEINEISNSQNSNKSSIVDVINADVVETSLTDIKKEIAASKSTVKKPTDKTVSKKK
jgi:hypothetical protein